MADTSRSQVTITLGRSGQVVKRAGAVLDSEFSDPVPAVGSKRSVRDRLGSNVDALHLDSKRQRGVDGRLSFRAINGVNDNHLSKDDLRFKIMKQTQSNGQKKNMDLRDVLSRQTRSSSTNHGMDLNLPDPRNGRQRAPQLTPEPRDDRRRMPEPRDDQWRIPDERRPLPEARDERQRMPEARDERQRMPEARDERQRMPEARDERQRMPEARDERQRMPEARDERQRMPEARDERQRMPEARDERQRMPEARDGRRLMREPIEVGQGMLKLNDDRQRIPNPTNGSMPRRVTSTRTSESLSQMDLSRNSYSPWTLDHIRRRSPNRVVDNSRGLSPPPPRMEEPQRRPIMREYNDPIVGTYASRDVHEIARPMTTASFPIKPSPFDGPTKPVGPLVTRQLPLGGIVQQSQYPVEHVTVEGFLHSLGLDKYVISFRVEEVDMAALSQMGEHDLKELGIPMGPRKKILLALLARARRQAR